MSVINKMLQDLDRRNAGGAESEPLARPVKSVSAGRRGHEGFWRVLAVLVLISLGWVGWVAYQLQPRSVATEQALRVSLQPRSAAVAAAEPVVQEAKPVEEKPVEEKPVEEKPAEEKPAEEKPAEEKPAEEKIAPAIEPSETFKLARAIETPIAERKAPVARPTAAKPPSVKPVAKTVPELPAVSTTAKGMVNKRETTKTAGEAGEAQFQRAALFLRQGRVSEAEEQLRVALQANPGHLGARQAYVSLLLEQQRVDTALVLLQDAVAVNPAHPGFTLTLARIYAEQRKYAAALDLMDKAGPVAENAEFQSLRGTVLLRLGRHAEAVSAYQKAVQAAQQPGETWTGLGISLEAVGRRADAAQAYHRALGAARLPKELREYAETRIRALE